MAWCHQATSHYLGQCWPGSMPSYGITRPQWVNSIGLVQVYGILSALTMEIPQFCTWSLVISTVLHIITGIYFSFRIAFAQTLCSHGFTTSQNVMCNNGVESITFFTRTLYSVFWSNLAEQKRMIYYGDDMTHDSLRHQFVDSIHMICHEVISIIPAWKVQFRHMIHVMTSVIQ